MSVIHISLGHGGEKEVRKLMMRARQPKCEAIARVRDLNLELLFQKHNVYAVLAGHIYEFMDEHEFIQAFELALKYGFDVNVEGPRCLYLPLPYACQWQNSKVIHWLLHHGASPFLTDSYGDNAWAKGLGNFLTQKELEDLYMKYNPLCRNCFIGVFANRHLNVSRLRNDLTYSLQNLRNVKFCKN